MFHGVGIGIGIGIDSSRTVCGRFLAEYKATPDRAS
jgi:hypothetical protein